MVLSWRCVWYWVGVVYGIELALCMVLSWCVYGIGIELALCILFDGIELALCMVLSWCVYGIELALCILFDGIELALCPSLELMYRIRSLFAWLNWWYEVRLHGSMQGLTM